MFTLYRTNAAVDVIGSGTLGTYGYNFPLIDAMNMKAYGLRELTFESRLIPASVDDLSQTYKARIGIDIIRGDRVQYAKAWGKALLKSTDKLFLGKQGKKDLQKYIEDNTQDELMNNAALRLIITEKRDRIWRWNRYNHLLESGMLTIKGRNAFVGQKIVSSENTNLFWTRGLFDPNTRLRNSKKGMEFYCVGVEQSGGWGRTWETTLSLSRGANMSELETYYNQRNLDKASGVANQIFARNTDGEK
jgi:hypothetical protein